MPVLSSSEASARALREAIVRQCGLPQDASGLLGLALGHAALDERVSLRGNDIVEGDPITLYWRHEAVTATAPQ